MSPSQTITEPVTLPGRLTTPGQSRSTLVAMYRDMLRIRFFEERLAELLVSSPDSIKCPCHLYTGQEAVAAGVCQSLVNDDIVFSTHRSHGHYIAKGGDIKTLMAEVHGRVTGCSKGKGGSMHLAAPDIGFPGSSAIVAGTISLAVGAALAFSIRKTNNVSVAFFGDGATGEGVFYESLNFASLRKLPVVFVCENNLYSTHMPITACLADPLIYKKATIFNMPGVRVDGNNVLEVYDVASKAIKNARLGRGPALIECMTYRWRGHVGPNFDIEQGLRTKKELDDWRGRCPIQSFERYLLDNGLLDHDAMDGIREGVNDEIDDAITFARDSPYPDPFRDLGSAYKV